MNSWRDDAGMVHTLSHVNNEKRAGRTFCSRYVEFWPKDLVEDVAVTCLTCLVEPTHSEVIERAQRDVDERGDDIVMRCQDHLYHRDEDGRCSRCGYYHRMEFKK